MANVFNCSALFICTQNPPLTFPCDDYLSSMINENYVSPRLEDFIGWDTYNWSRALKYWEKNTNIDSGELYCLELGGNQGGLSLWLEKKGNIVICSDLHNPKESAKQLHNKFGVKNITYKAINALEIPYSEEFDIIVFKSILGGISRNGEDENKKKVIDQIYKALKPGGYLIFAENLEASIIHKLFRKLFVKWGNQWNYLKLKEVDELFNAYDNLHYTTFGFWGAFGRNEIQRKLLGRIDQLINFIIPRKANYIVIGAAKKPYEKKS